MADAGFALVDGAVLLGERVRPTTEIAPLLIPGGTRPTTGLGAGRRRAAPLAMAGQAESAISDQRS